MTAVILTVGTRFTRESDMYVLISGMAAICISLGDIWAHSNKRACITAHKELTIIRQHILVFSGCSVARFSRSPATRSVYFRTGRWTPGFVDMGSLVANDTLLSFGDIP